MNASIECITVDENRVSQMASNTWGDIEKPIVCVPAEYKLKPKDSFSNGFVMITRGTNYIFKKKFKDTELITKFHTLDVRSMRLDKQIIFIEFDDENYEIKSKDAVYIIKAIRTILDEATYGLNDLNKFSFETLTPIEDTFITKRPADNLKYRALFLAHFYGMAGDQLNAINYFDKWESRQNPMIVLGPSFHPGNFAAAFGHAIGWEMKLNTLCFQCFMPTQFSRMLQSVLETTQTIHRIAFTDYTTSDRVPSFHQITSIYRTCVSSWQFARVHPSLFVEFGTFSKALPKNSIRQIIVSNNENIQWQSIDVSNFVDAVMNSEALQNTHEFIFRQISINPYPIDSFSRFVSIATGLKILTIQKFDNCDASDLLSAVCNSTLRQISIVTGNFEKALPPETKLPSTLLLLNVSNSTFSNNAYLSLLGLLVREELQNPLIFKCRYITVDTNVYQTLGSVNFQACKANLSEIDYSGNKLPLDTTRFFFAYLFTQKKLRLVVMNDMGADDPTQLMQFIISLITNLQLPGIEFSGLFPAGLLIKFMNAIATQQQCYCLRRIGFANSLTGDEGCEALSEIVAKLPNLTDLFYDNTEAQNYQPLIKLLTICAQSKTLVSCDLPNLDLKKLRGKKPPKEIKDIYTVVKEKKKRPSTVDRRFDYLESLIDSGKDIKNIGPEIFVDALKAELITNDDLYLQFSEKGTVESKDTL